MNCILWYVTLNNISGQRKVRVHLGLNVDYTSENKKIREYHVRKNTGFVGT